MIDQSCQECLQTSINCDITKYAAIVDDDSDITNEVAITKAVSQFVRGKWVEPFFVRYVNNGVREIDGNDYEFLITEDLGSTSMDANKYFQILRMSRLDFFKFICQVFLALDVLQNLINYYHMDLKMSNIIIQHKTSRTFYEAKHFDCDFQVVIIDYGESALLPYIESNYIENSSSFNKACYKPGFDAFRLVRELFINKESFLEPEAFDLCQDLFSTVTHGWFEMPKKELKEKQNLKNYGMVSGTNCRRMTSRSFQTMLEQCPQFRDFLESL